MKVKPAKILVYTLTLGMVLSMVLVFYYAEATNRANAAIDELAQNTHYGSDAASLYRETSLNMTTLQWFYDESRDRMYNNLLSFTVFGCALAAVIMLGFPNRDKYGGAKIPDKGEAEDTSDNRAA